MIIVTLAGEIISPNAPFLHADDLGVLRGDGIFETLLVHSDTVLLLEEHLQRFIRSAEAMQLPRPSLDQYRHAIKIACAEFYRHHHDDAILRLIYTRGREHSPTPTAYVMVTSIPERVPHSRQYGVSAITLERGYDLNVSAKPWLLSGVKTLAYAINMAALRYAASCEADDVIFLSNDHYVLEGPRSTVVIFEHTRHHRRIITPPPTHPILVGTTQQALFRIAQQQGWDCCYQPISDIDLRRAHNIWLVSSVTLGARVHTLDGHKITSTIPDEDIHQLLEAVLCS